MSSSPPPASSPDALRRMQSARRRDTKPELALRSELHRRGLRFFVDRAPIPGTRRRADLVFPAERIAMYVDGCFWHGCAIHATWPKANAAWWRDKIESNRQRDADTDRTLLLAGWTTVRVWEHEEVPVAAARVADALQAARARRRDVTRSADGSSSVARQTEHDHRSPK